MLWYAETLFLRNVAVFQNCVKLRNTHMHDEGERPRLCLRKSKKQSDSTAKLLRQVQASNRLDSSSWVWLSETSI